MSQLVVDDEVPTTVPGPTQAPTKTGDGDTGAKKGLDDDDVSINSELDFNERQHGISFAILHSKDIL